MAKLYPFKFYSLSRTIKPINEGLWFESHQVLLLRIVNSDEGRELLGIDASFPLILKIGKNHITGKLSDGRYKTEFRVGAKWANAIRYKWPQFIEVARKFYDDPVNLKTQILLEKKLLWAATTSTFYPDPDVETTTVDGRVGHNLGVGSGISWATLISAAGNESADNETDHVPSHIVADSSTSNWRIIRRGIYLFDTSALPDSDSILSATLSIYGKDKAKGPSWSNADIALNIYASAPASNTSLTGTDYATLGSTAFCDTSITYASWSITGYNDFAFNANGLNSISKTSITKLGAKDSVFDASGSAPTWYGSEGIYIRGYFADQTGTANDPKLVVIHIPPSPPTGSLTYSGYAPSTITGMFPSPTTGSLAYTGYAPTTQINGITLTDLTEGKIYQRSGTSASVTVSGTYVGLPTSIEARIVVDGTLTEVVAWTTLVASPGGGTFSGVISVIQGGWYNVQVRFSNSTPTVSNGVNAWGVGILIGCIGQSNMHSTTTGWFSIGTDHTASSLLRKYTTAGGWETLSIGNGAISFGNKLITALNIPVGLLNYGVNGSALRAEAVTSYGYWLDLTAGEPYALFLTGVTATGGGLEFVVWIQGEREANSGVVTEAEYKTSIEAFITLQIRADITNRSSSPNLPFIASTLGRCTTGVAADWQGIRNALYWLEGGVADCYAGATAIDLPLMDAVHISATGQTTHGQRMAQTVLDILGNETYHRGAVIDYAAIVNTQTIDVYLTHTAGSDFTPITAITGFEIYDSGTAETITSATRSSATIIRLVISGTITGTATVSYLYGANPTITSSVYDNTAMTLPLEVEDIVVVKGLGISTGSITYTGLVPSIPLASPGVGAITYISYAPTILAGVRVYPKVGTIAITGYAPSLSLGITLEGVYNLCTALPTLAEIEASMVLAKQAKLDDLDKWVLNKLVESSDGTSVTLYDDDGVTPLKTWAYNASTKTRSKAT